MEYTMVPSFWYKKINDMKTTVSHASNHIKIQPFLVYPKSGRFIKYIMFCNLYGRMVELKRVTYLTTPLVLIGQDIFYLHGMANNAQAIDKNIIG